jgi:hypothetical protein
MSAVPTVKIVHPKDPKRYLVINEADLDPKLHKLWTEPKPASGKAAEK